MRNFRKILVFTLVIFLGSMVFGVVHASGFVPPSLAQYFGSNTNQYLNNLIGNIINFVFVLSGLVALVMIIMAGFQWMTGDSEDKKKKAKEKIISAVVGLLIIIFSYLIVQLIFSLLGLSSPNSITLPCGINGSSGVSGCLQNGTSPTSSSNSGSGGTYPGS